MKNNSFFTDEKIQQNPCLQQIVIDSDNSDIKLFRVLDGIQPAFTETLYTNLIIPNFAEDEREEKNDFQAFYSKNPSIDSRRENINIIAISKGICVGLLTGMAFHNSKLGYFDYLVVDESSRSKGVGGIIFQAGIQVLKTIAQKYGYDNANLAVLLTVEKPNASLNLDKGQDSKKRLSFYERQNCKRVGGMPCIVPEISDTTTGIQKPAIVCYDWLIAGVNRKFQNGEIVMDRETALKFNIDNIDLQYDNNGLKAEDTKTYKEIIASLENKIYVVDLT